MTQPNPNQDIIDFGFTQEADGSLVEYRAGVPREKWEPTEGGFLRFTRADGVWDPVPYTIAPAFEGTGGLNHTTHPQCFEYTYPADYVRNIYAVALAERAAQG